MKNIVIMCSLLLILASCGNTEIKTENTEVKVDNTTTIDNENTDTTGILDESNTDEYIVDESDFLDGNKLIKDIKKNGELSDNEKDGLILMREEEKLAYDVYVTMYEKWGQKIFNNISKSEKTHMEAVKDLLISYNIEDPILDDTIGIFTSEKLQKLYNDLVMKGNSSLVDALIVGITIEDLDIYDLDELSSKTTRIDILTVYDNLNRGSRNHMRAFYKNVEKKGGTYEVQFISNEKYTEIINGEQEKGK